MSFPYLDDAPFNERGTADTENYPCDKCRDDCECPDENEEASYD